MNYDDFADLGQTSFGSGEPSAPKVDPKDEWIHNVFICGKMRKDEDTGKMQQPGTLNGRGLPDLIFNASEVHMIPIHSKIMSVKEKTANNRTNIECFSYKTSMPAIGTSGRTCPANAADRDAGEDFCKPCRSHIILAGILSDEYGKPILQESKPVFIFLRGKGTKYGGISNYLYECSNLDVPFLFDPKTPEQERFEKTVINFKRFVCKITIDLAPSAFGDQQVYKLERGNELNVSVVQDIMGLSKKSLEKFNERFDWSSRKKDDSGQQQQPTPSQPPIKSEPVKQQASTQSAETNTKTDFSFEDISF